MNEVQPIRDLDKLEGIKQHLKETNRQDYMLFLVAIYTGFRTADILSLTIGDIKGTHIELREQETGLRQRILIHKVLRKELDLYLSGKSDDERLFDSSAADSFKRAMKFAARWVGLTAEVGADTLRKTWGYQLYKQTEKADQITMLMTLSVFFNHKNTLETMDYLQIYTQEDLDRAMTDFEL